MIRLFSSSNLSALLMLLPLTPPGPFREEASMRQSHVRPIEATVLCRYPVQSFIRRGELDVFLLLVRESSSYSRVALQGHARHNRTVEKRVFGTNWILGPDIWCLQVDNSSSY